MTASIEAAGASRRPDVRRSTAGRGRPLKGVFAVARKEIVILLRDPALVVLLFVAPLALILFLSDAVGGGADLDWRPVRYVAAGGPPGAEAERLLGRPAAVVPLDQARSMVERGAVAAAVAVADGRTTVIVDDNSDPMLAGRFVARLAGGFTAVVDAKGRPYSHSRSSHQQSVPGFALMFAFFGAGFTGQAFFREHDWGTWNRTLSLPMTKGAVLVGKALPVGFVVFVQGVLLVVGGALLFDLPLALPLVLLGALALVGFVSCALGLLLIAVTRSSLQVAQLTNLIVLFLGALGGAIAPRSVMPGWAQALSPGTPHYWAMKLVRGAMEGPLTSRLLGHALVLAAFGVVFAMLGWWRTAWVRTTSE